MAEHILVILDRLLPAILAFSTLAGAVLSVWSAIRTRNRYYKKFLEDRKLK